jgi:poly(hydroxyalkanoate) depolymerase family esterase
MNDMFSPNKMVEVTRLTRAGRLAEATALLQRILRGETAVDKSGRADGETTSMGREPAIIDAEAVTIKEMEHPPSPRTDTDARAMDMSFFSSETPAQPHTWRGLRALLGRVKRPSDLGLDSRRQSIPVRRPDIVPEGGKFIEAAYSNSAGSRTYKLYIPSGYHGQALPLIVMLHGCTQSADDFAAGTRMNLIAEEHTCFVAYPEQPREANAAKCWNWFRPSDQQRGEGEPSLIEGITRQITGYYSVDPQRIYIGGLSAGAAAAAVMGATYPDVYAAIGVHSGIACGAAHDIASAFAAMRQGHLSTSSSQEAVVPTIVFHGDRDNTVHPRNGDHIIPPERTVNLQKHVHRGRAPAGHAYTRTMHTDTTGRTLFEHWEIHGAGHAWSGGSPAGSYTDPRGPDAAREMLRFFLEHARCDAP